MNIQAVAILVIIGVLAAFLVSWLLQKSRFGLVGNLVVGVAGSFLGGRILTMLGIYFDNYLLALLSAFVGALLLLIALRLIAPPTTGP